MLRYYLIEEYRRHISIARKYSFFIFPLYIIFFTFVGGIFIGDVLQIFPYTKFIRIVMMSTFIYGFGVGSFEFLGRTYEKFKLVNTSSILPLSNRKNYFYAFLRDSIYYTLLFLIPTFVGLILTIPFSSLGLYQISFFTLSLFLSLFLGYSFSYFSFSLYFRKKIFYYSFLASLLVYLFLTLLFPVPFPLADFQIRKEISYFFLIVILILLFNFFAYVLTPEEFYEERRNYAGKLWKYRKVFRNMLFAKDMEDVLRAHVIFKSLLTYFFPMLLLFIFVRVLNMASSKNIYNSISLSIMLSIFSVVIYSWLTIMDDYRYFSNLPLKSWELVKAHIKTHVFLVSVISIPIIIIINFFSPLFLLISLILFYLNCIYLLSVVALLAGHRVTSMLFDPEIIMKFTIYSIVPGIILTIASISLSPITFIFISITAVFMLLISIFNFESARKKWVYF